MPRNDDVIQVGKYQVHKDSPEHLTPALRASWRPWKELKECHLELLWLYATHTGMTQNRAGSLLGKKTTTIRHHFLTLKVGGLVARPGGAGYRKTYRATPLGLYALDYHFRKGTHFMQVRDTDVADIRDMFKGTPFAHWERDVGGQSKGEDVE